MKKATVIIWLSILLAGIGAGFWYSELIYRLPTPVPANYTPLAMGSPVKLPATVSTGNKPVFLHFFNPGCPCSKFNITHFKSLAKEYGQQADFKVIVMSTTNYTASQIQARFDLDIPILFDTAIARNCGVYSTPQAVIIDEAGKLYYRGNYNRTRYCTDKKTEYARMALTDLLYGRHPILFDQLALKAYGCQLPKCSK